MSRKAAIFFAILFLCLSVNAQNTASANISVFELPAPQLDTLKTIRIYLPESYASSTSCYPVLYMHDAQNLFNKETSYVGEWEVDEYLDSLATKEVIVVGIDHGNAKRIDELTPFKNEKYGGGNGNAYLQFITQTLKPYIDKKYRTYSEREHTSIIGSSLGGLISFYAALEYPDTFGKIGVFSPSFWYSDKIYEKAKEVTINKDTKFYFLAGTEEDENLISEIEKMLEILREKGVEDKNIAVKYIEGGKHNEALWSKNFPEAFEWLQQ